jgi:prolipoprotein diacylglyceryl transferase
MAMAMTAHIPSPPINSFNVGPLVIHFYALAYLVGIAAAIIITRRRWRAVGGDPELVGDIALWSVPAGIIGGRIYFDVTTPMDIPHVWYGVFAVWDGGLGIWGGIAGATVVGIWRLRRHGVSVPMFMDAVAPALLVAQGIGRIGNYFNKELFGRPTSLPWGLEIPYQYRVSGGIPARYLNYGTFQPTFLYELIFNFAWAAALVWLGHHRKIKPPGLFALYVFGYSAYRIFEESLRIDSSVYFLGLRLNTYIASALAIIGAVWFYRSQRKPPMATAGAAVAGSGATGSAATGSAAAVGSAAVAGSGATGSAATGSAAVGSAAAGSTAAAGSGATGSTVTTVDAADPPSAAAEAPSGSASSADAQSDDHAASQEHAPQESLDSQDATP